MKTRTGFVSNSSSASFVIAKHLLSPVQIKNLVDYTYEPTNTDGWSVRDDGNYIEGSTSMDNDAIEDLFDYLGIDPNIIKWNSD